MSIDDPRRDDAVIPLEALPPCRRGLSRRDFCAVAGSGLVALGLSGCGGDPRVSTGGLEDPNDPGGAGGSGGVGGAGGTGGVGGTGGTGGVGGTGGTGGVGGTGGTGGTGGVGGTGGGGGGTMTCGSGLLNAGSATAITVNQAKHFTDNRNYDLYVCRDSGGLFTVDAQCTHAGCDVKLSSGRWSCPCHGARFNFDGTGPTAPAFSPLNNYQVCVDAGGTIYVNYNQVVSHTTRV